MRSAPQLLVVSLVLAGLSSMTAAGQNAWYYHVRVVFHPTDPAGPAPLLRNPLLLQVQVEYSKRAVDDGNPNAGIFKDVAKHGSSLQLLLKFA